MKLHEYNQIVNHVKNITEKFESGEITKYRITIKVWRHILLHNKEKIMIKGYCEELVAKNIGAGIYEITLKGE